MKSDEIVAAIAAITKAGHLVQVEPGYAARDRRIEATRATERRASRKAIRRKLDGILSGTASKEERNDSD